MSKKYISAEELYTEAQRGKSVYKPNGTMGQHHCTIGLKDGYVQVDGSVQGSVALGQGDTLGYDCGSVWLVPSPASYTDPIRKALAEHRVPQSALKYTTDPVKWVGGWSDSLPGSVADRAEGERATLLGGGQTIEDNQDNSPREGYCPGCWRTNTDNGTAKAVIVREVVERGTTFVQETKVVRVVVRPQWRDDKEVIAWIEANL